MFENQFEEKVKGEKNFIWERWPLKRYGKKDKNNIVDNGKEKFCYNFKKIYS